MAEMRLAQRKDIPQLVALGEEFALLSQPVHGFSISRERIINFANDVVETQNCLTIVLEEDKVIVGLMVGIISKIFFSEDVALQELVWYVKKGFRGLMMIDAFEKMAVGMGANKVCVGNKPAFYDLQRFYLRRGYTMLENQYIKSVGG
jgi:hypothetical protein